MAKTKPAGEQAITPPYHLAVIMDGNGRWAQKRGLPRSFGHKKGVAALTNLIENCMKYGIKVLSVYAFSTENWSRPEEEIRQLFSMIRDYFDDTRKRFMETGVRVRVMGMREGLDEATVNSINSIEKVTAANDTITFNIGFNYGSRGEIVHAVNKLLASGKTKIEENDLVNALYTAGIPDPDFVIRTSGEMRLSNFMMYQCAYAELYFTDVYWPDFNEKELKKALIDYGGRARRFGGV